MVMLRSSDGRIFQVNEAVVQQWPRIMREIEKNDAENEIHLPITGKILSMVIEYCRRHVEAGEDVEAEGAEEDDNLHGDALMAWDLQFLDVRRIVLNGLWTAAEYLEIQSLLNLAIQTATEMGRAEGMSHEEIFKRNFDMLAKKKPPSDSFTIAKQAEKTNILARMPPDQKIVLISSDRKPFEVDLVVALEMHTIMHMFNPIPLPNVKSAILSKVIEYCKKHVESDDDDALTDWDREFVKVHQDTLFDLILAASYLNIKGLLDLTRQTVADMIKRKTPDETSKIFNIEKDISSDEEEELRRESQCAFNNDEGEEEEEQQLIREGFTRMVKLRSSDEVIFEVAEVVARKSQTIKRVIEDVGAENAIPLSNVTSAILSKVIEYCKKHVESRNDDDALEIWDSEFVKVDQITVFDLISAANYLDIPSLLNLTCQAVADMIKGKTPDEIKKVFTIKNDFTPEEEEEVRRENRWAFE